MTTPRNPGYPHPASRLARSQAGGVLGDMKTPPRPLRRARRWAAAPGVVGLVPAAGTLLPVETSEAIVAVPAVAAGADE